MEINNERKLFEEWCFSSGLVTNKRFFEFGGKDDDVSSAWEAWKASANREGFVLVPIKCTNNMAHAGKGIDGRLSAFKCGDIWEAMIKASQENK